MGQAFDRNGNVLGEAYGDSKREVFEKLTAEFKDAHELRIKSLSDSLSERDALLASQRASFDSENAKAEGRIAQQRDPQPDRMMRFFTYAHLPAHLQAASKPFCDLAEFIVATLPSNPERTVALRKLLEAKDCAVRALLES